MRLAENVENNSQGLLVVVSGPAGAGKGTLCNELRRQCLSLRFSVSVTTRAPRPQEQEGLHYYFRTHEEFRRMREQGELLEWAEYVGNYYGTPRFAVEDALNEGYDVVLEIEIKGAMQIKKNYPQAVFIFIVPPSMSVLSERIHNRGTESEEVIQKRLAQALEELEYVSEYDYVVVNDEVAVAVDKLKSILKAEKCRVKRRRFVFKPDGSMSGD